MTHPALYKIGHAELMKFYNAAKSNAIIDHGPLRKRA